jgi:hypothetical protein
LRRRRGGAPTATIEEALSLLAPKNHRGGIVGLKPTAPNSQDDESVDATNFEDAESLTSSTRNLGQMPSTRRGENIVLLNRWDTVNNDNFMKTG